MARHQINPQLLARAGRLVAELQPGLRSVGELRDVVMGLWETAASASEAHRDLLAIFESAVRQIDDDRRLTDSDLMFFRVSIHDLQRDLLYHGDVAAARVNFRRCGFTALAFVE